MIFLLTFTKEQRRHALSLLNSFGTVSNDILEQKQYRVDKENSVALSQVKSLASTFFRIKFPWKFLFWIVSSENINTMLYYSNKNCMDAIQILILKYFSFFLTQRNCETLWKYSVFKKYCSKKFDTSGVFIAHRERQKVFIHVWFAALHYNHSLIFW